MKPQWIDISIPLKNAMVHWPGDPEIKIEKVKDIHAGDPATVSRLNFGSHTGTHMDAPAHFIPNGIPIDAMPLDATLGPARVLEIKNPKCIQPEDLLRHKIKKGERILFKTENSARAWQTGRFMKDFVYISLEAAQALAKIGIQTVGVDYLSVGGYFEDGAKIHKALLSKGIWIIEGLNLANVKPGRYELACLPLKIFQGDGAPCRAALKPF